MEGIINDINLKYLTSLRSELDPLLSDMNMHAKENDVPVVSQEVGRFLELMTLIKDPDNVLEIGTAIGFSGIMIARALKTGGKLTTIERSAPSMQVARENFTRAGLLNKVELLVGDALEVLPRLDGPYEMVFIDAWKEEYEQYLDFAIELVEPGGVIILDNLLWQGQTAGMPSKNDRYKAATQALRKFNKKFLKHPKLRAEILPVGDGIGLAVVI